MDILLHRGNALAEKYIADGDEQTGVRAAEDGYCFGRKSMEEAIAVLARGELIVIVDDEGQENEGDFIMAADRCTPAATRRG